MAEPKSSELMEKIVSLCKRKGLIFQSSEIYGGLNGFWDYGPLGAELKRNIKGCWWRAMAQQRDDVVGLEASIIMHPKIWEASGHTSTFSDPMVDCLLSKKRFRADQIEAQSGTAYHYTGAKDQTTGKQIAEAYSVLLPAGNDLFDLQFDSALNLNRVKQRLIVLTLFVDGNQSVFAGASACLCESLVRLRYFARGKRGASDGVVPLDLEWT